MDEELQVRQYIEHATKALTLLDSIELTSASIAMRLYAQTLLALTHSSEDGLGKDDAGAFVHTPPNAPAAERQSLRDAFEQLNETLVKGNLSALPLNIANVMSGDTPLAKFNAVTPPPPQTLTLPPPPKGPDLTMPTARP
jgi:hypothetical protein